MMWKPMIALASILTAATLAGAAPATAPTTAPADVPAAPPPADSKVVAVTVYQGDALVTRQVQVKEGQGLMELVVGPLPPTTIDSSLYTEGTDGIRILTTRFRTRAVKEDTRAEVRAKEEQIHRLTAENSQIQKQIEVAGQNVLLLGKLENFTSATLLTLTDKGLLNSENTMKLANFIMDTRGTLGKSQVDLQQQVQANTESIAFLQRQLSELAAGADRTEREAVIVVDKAGAAQAAGKVRLNYLVSAAGWEPQYKLRAGTEKDPVTVEYLAAIQQQSGEDWTGVDLVLSTAQPMLNAAPPDLSALDVDVSRLAANGNNDNPQAVMNKLQSYQAAQNYRRQAQQELLGNNAEIAQGSLNSAAASEQYAELLAKETPGETPAQNVREGPSVAYHLEHKLTVPTRSDQQFVEIARLEMDPTYFYKSVPVLSQHVYRLAELTNKSKYVLLPGEATMYVGTDFVGRMRLPLVAIGEEFVAGFGIDPQIQVERQLVSKNHAIQGGNQVQTYDYRIRISSFKANDVTLQVWDRLPHPETDAVAVELVKSMPELSQDPDYQRNDRPRNLLRWDMSVKANTSGANASAITYEFKLQYAKDVSIGNFKAKR
ncbi:MAG TPA: DUF4139 domain-containing protein [Tepidisphaeraceae bacterium]|jgi:uncharacterized protein (TIGR02231 family)|nr:DUF4139 domain-containing protein [Tepidisphaeraceae bacterium]